MGHAVLTESPDVSVFLCKCSPESVPKAHCAADVPHVCSLDFVKKSRLIENSNKTIHFLLVFVRQAHHRSGYTGFRNAQTSLSSVGSVETEQVATLFIWRGGRNCSTSSKLCASGDVNEKQVVEKKPWHREKDSLPRWSEVPEKFEG